MQKKKAKKKKKEKKTLCTKQRGKRRIKREITNQTLDI